MNTINWSIAKVEANVTEGPKGDRKRVSVGFYDLPYATVMAFKDAINSVKVDVDASAVSADNTEGITVYSSDSPLDADVVNWLQSAILAKIKVKGSNQLVTGTNKLMDGKAFAIDFETLLESGERGGAHQRLKAESVVAFVAYLTGLGKSTQVVEGFRAMFRQPADVLSHQPEKYKMRMQEYLTGFASSLSAENVERYKKFLVAVEDAAASTEEEDMLA